MNWICNPAHKHREMRGVTSAGRKYRGLHGKGHLHTKCRPSRRATWKKNNEKSLRRYRCAHALCFTLRDASAWQEAHAPHMLDDMMGRVVLSVCRSICTAPLCPLLHPSAAVVWLSFACVNAAPNDVHFGAGDHHFGGWLDDLWLAWTVGAVHGAVWQVLLCKQRSA